MEKDKELINSIMRAVQVLETLCEEDKEIGISELSKRIDCNKSSAYRIIRTLTHTGLVSKNSETSKYYLGVKLLNLAVNKMNSFSIIPIAKPFLDKLSKDSNKVVSLNILEDNVVTCIDTSIPKSYKTHFYVRIGSRMPFHCSASGKVIAAFQEDHIISTYFENNLEVFTINTLSDKEEIFNEIEKIRTNGYSTCNEEMEKNVIAIASPIRNIEGHVFASVCITMIKNSSEISKEIIEQVRECGASISKELGFRN